MRTATKVVWSHGGKWVINNGQSFGFLGKKKMGTNLSYLKLRQSSCHLLKRLNHLKHWTGEVFKSTNKSSDDY